MDGQTSLAARLRARLAQKAARKPVAEADRPVLSAGQRALLAQERILGETSAFTSVRAWTLDGALDEAAAARAVEALQRRQQALRLRLTGPGAAPEPRFDAPIRPLEISDLAAAADPEADVEAALDALARRRLDCANGPATTFQLMRLRPGRWVFAAALHHLLVDDWSFSVLIDDFQALYAAETGQAEAPPPLALDYAAAMARVATAEAGRAAGPTNAAAPAALDWPSRRTNAGQVDAPTAETALAEVAPQRVAALRRLAAARGESVFPFLVSAFQLLLGRYCAQNDLAVATAFSTRRPKAEERLVGMFVQQGAFPADLSPGRTALQLFEANSAAMRSIRQGAPQETPSAQAMIVYYKTPEARFEAAGLRCTPLRLKRRSIPTDLHLSLRGTAEGGLSVEMAGRSSIFDPRDLETLAATYGRILARIAEDPEQRLDRLDVASPAQRAASARIGVATAPYDAVTDLPSQFERAARRWPDAPALRSPSGAWSYRALDQLGDGIAAWLRTKGVREGDAVAVALPRGAALAAAQLGALKAGAVIVSIDPTHPEARRRQMAEIAECRWTLSDAPAEDGPTPIPHLALPPLSRFDATAAAAPVPRAAGDPARLGYIFFTSGTTGRPKAVMATHRGVARFLAGLPKPALGPGDRTLLLTSPSFDPIMIELWGALLQGAEAIAPEGPLQSARAMLDLIEGERVTACCMTSGVFNLLVDAAPERLSGMRWILTGGEVLSPRHARIARQAAPDTAIWNVYGPTENAMYTTAYPIGDAPPAPAPIGRPMANNMVFVLGPDRRPVPAGFAGEIHVGGDGLALGYRNAPERADAFISLPGPQLGLARDEIRLYRTGDRGRWSADQQLEFLGRIDHQIKFSGVRIEPAEVEQALGRLEGVSAAALIPDRDPETGAVVGLTAFVETDERPFAPAKLRAELLTCLPRQMAPTRWVRVDRMPLNVNGKIDRNALQAPEPRPASPAEADLSGVDPALVSIWRSALPNAALSAQADFFVLGGDSLEAMRMLAAVEKRFACAIDVARFLKDPRLEALQRLMTRARPGASDRVQIFQEGAPDQTPVVFAFGVNGSAHWALEAVRAWDARRPLYGLSPGPATDWPAGAGGLEQIADELLEALKPLLKGPRVHLVGYSFGGFLAAVLANRAERAGVEIDRLVMIDSSSHFRLRIGGARLEQADATGVQTRLKSLKSNSRLRPIDGPIDFIRCTERFGLPPRRHAVDWRPYTRSEVRLHEIGGDHGSIVKRAMAPRLAAAIEDILSDRRAPCERLEPAPWPETWEALAAQYPPIARTGATEALKTWRRRLLTAAVASGVEPPYWLIGPAARAVSNAEEADALHQAVSTLPVRDGAVWQALASAGWRFKAPWTTTAAEAATALDGPVSLSALELVRAYCRDGQIEAARGVAEAALATRPRDPHSLLADAMIHRASGDMERFAARLDAITDHPDLDADHMRYVFRAVLRPRDGQIARKLLERVAARIGEPAATKLRSVLEVKFQARRQTPPSTPPSAALET